MLICLCRVVVCRGVSYCFSICVVWLVLSVSSLCDTPELRRVALFGTAWYSVVQRGTILVRLLMEVRGFYGL